MKLNLDNLQISTHAQQRAIERCKLDNTKLKEVNRYIRRNLSLAEYVGKVSSSDGTESELFVNGSVCFHLSLDQSVVKTVIKIDNKVPFSPITDKVKCLVHKEFRKLDRAEKARIKKLELFKRESDAEISYLKLREYKSRSQAVKFSCQGRIAALELRKQELENQLIQIKTDKRQVVKTLLTVI
jgi:hypothetical protein